MTTLLDGVAYTAESLANLYATRWRVEENLKSLKVTMKMDVLKCRTVDGVVRVAEGPVSRPPPPSSNRTSGFPASGLPEFSRSGHAQDQQPSVHNKRRPRSCTRWA